MTFEALEDYRRQHAQRPVSPALAALQSRLADRFGQTLCATLFYGSCLRGGDPYDGLVDLYVIVEGYGAALGRGLAAAFNCLLPPNVYYLETQVEGRTVRAKYAVVSRRDFLRGTSRRWFHSYLWARFAQPIGVLYVRHDSAADVYRALAQAVGVFLTRALPLMPPRFRISDLWRTGLLRTYRAELRAEKQGRTEALVRADGQYYATVTRLALPRLFQDPPGSVADGDPVLSLEQASLGRLWSRLGWWVRTAQGKLLSVLRLLKAAFTFSGGLDYIVWKLERHSGQKIEVPDRVRRYPWLFIWGLAWRLRRRGVFR